MDERRRTVGRRVEDREREHAFTRANPRLQRLALAAVVMWAVIGTLAWVTTWLQDSRNTQALALARQSTHVLQLEVNGECLRVDYLRWQDDLFRYSAWQRDLFTGHFLSRGISPAVKGLGRLYLRAAYLDRFLPYTDCRRALAHPLAYSPPSAIPFHALSPRTLARQLEHPDFDVVAAPPLATHP